MDSWGNDEIQQLWYQATLLLKVGDLSTYSNRQLNLSECITDKRNVVDKLEVLRRVKFEVLKAVMLESSAVSEEKSPILDAR